jgi:putative transposase
MASLSLGGKMKKGPFTEDQLVGMLREADWSAVAVVEKEHGIIEQTLYNWRKHFAGLAPSDIKRLRQMEQESDRLKKIVAERDLEIEVTKGINAKNGELAGPAGLHADQGVALDAGLRVPVV